MHHHCRHCASAQVFLSYTSLHDGDKCPAVSGEALSLSMNARSKHREGADHLDRNDHRLCIDHWLCIGSDTTHTEGW